MSAVRAQPSGLDLKGLLTALGLLVALVWVLQPLTAPLSSVDDDPVASQWQLSWLGHNGARYSQIARNHTRYGLTHLGGAPLLDAGVHDPARPDVYGHHPPGLGWTLALVFKLTGVSENAARGVSSVATVISLVLLGLLVGGVAGRVWGGVAALAAASMPMVSLYGMHVDVQGPPVLAASLATVWAYRRWLSGSGSLIWVLMFSGLGSAFDWYGLYAPAGCALHLFVYRPDRRGPALGLAAWTAALFFGWVAWLGSLPGMSVGRVFDAASVRGAAGLFDDPLLLAGYVQAWLGETLELMPGWPALLAVALAVMGGAWGTGRAANGGLSGRALVLLLTLPVLVHGLAFPQGLLVHGYWLFALPYGLAAALALGLRRLHPLVTVAALLILVLAGRQGLISQTAPRRIDIIAPGLGRALEALTPSDAVILTNYDVNPLDASLPAGYVLKRPEFGYYADRVVRGRVTDPQALQDALEAQPDATHFLLTPPTARWLEQPPPPAVKAALDDRTPASPRRVPAPVEIWLYEL